MRCVIARYPFDLSKSGVPASMKGVTPEIVTGESVTIGRRRYPPRLHLPCPPRRRARAGLRSAPDLVGTARRRLPGRMRTGGKPPFGFR